METSESKKTKVVVISYLKIIKTLMKSYVVENPIEVDILDPEDISLTQLQYDIVVIDHHIITENLESLRSFLVINSSALIISLIDSESKDKSKNKQKRASFENLIDWSVSFTDASKVLKEAIQINQIIRRRAERGIFFDELLSVSRNVKHESFNALALATGSARLLAKIPGVAENKHYIFLTKSLDNLAVMLGKLVDYHEKYKKAGLYDKKAG